MPLSKNHNKKECHSKKRKRFAKRKYDEIRKGLAFNQAEEISKGILDDANKGRMSKLREKFANKFQPTIHKKDK